MNHDVINGLSILAYLSLGTVGLTALAAWALKRFK